MRMRLHDAASRIRTGRNRTTPAFTRSAPTAAGHPGCRELLRHRFTVRFRGSAALSEEGDVDELAGPDLIDFGGDDHQAVGFGECRQEVR